MILALGRDASNSWVLSPLNRDFKKYVLQGIFNDSRFKNRSKLALRHFYNNYEKDSGGYSMSIDWSGCPRSNSENINSCKKKGSDLKEVKWVDVNDSIIKKVDNSNAEQKDQKDVGFLKISANSILDNCAQDSKDCKIFLRIKLETKNNDEYKYYNAHGQYYVSMSEK